MARERKTERKSENTKKRRPPNLDHSTARRLQKNPEKYRYRALFDSKVAKKLQEASRYLCLEESAESPRDLELSDKSLDHDCFGPVKSRDSAKPDLSYSEAFCPQKWQADAHGVYREPACELSAETDESSPTSLESGSAPLLLLSFGQDFLVVPVSLPEISNDELGDLSSHSKTVVKTPLRDFYSLSRKLCVKCRSALKCNRDWLFRKCPCQDLSKQTRVVVERLFSQQEDMKDRFQSTGVDTCTVKKEDHESVHTDANGNIKNVVVNGLAENKEPQVKAELEEDKRPTELLHGYNWHLPYGMDGKQKDTRRLSPLRIPKNKIIFPTQEDDGEIDDDDKTPEYPLQQKFYVAGQTQKLGILSETEFDPKDRNVFSHLYSTLSTSSGANHDEKLSVEKRLERDRPIGENDRELQLPQPDGKTKSVNGISSQIKSYADMDEETEVTFPSRKSDLGRIQFKIDPSVLQRKCKVQSNIFEPSCREIGNGRSKDVETKPEENGITIKDNEPVSEESELVTLQIESDCKEREPELRLDNTHNGRAEASDRQNDQIPRLSPVVKSHSHTLLPSPLCSSQPPTLYPVGEDKGFGDDRGSDQENHILQKAKRELPLTQTSVQQVTAPVFRANEIPIDTFKVEEDLKVDKTFGRVVENLKNTESVSSCENNCPPCSGNAPKESHESKSANKDGVVIGNKMNYLASQISQFQTDVKARRDTDNKCGPTVSVTDDNHNNVDLRDYSRCEINSLTGKSSDQSHAVLNFSGHKSTTLAQTIPGTRSSLSLLDTHTKRAQPEMISTTEDQKQTQLVSHTKNGHVPREESRKEIGDSLGSQSHHTDVSKNTFYVSKQASLRSSVSAAIEETAAERAAMDSGLSKDLSMEKSPLQDCQPQNRNVISYAGCNAADRVKTSGRTSASEMDYQSGTSLPVTHREADQNGARCQPMPNECMNRTYLVGQPHASIHDNHRKLNKIKTTNNQADPEAQFRDLERISVKKKSFRKDTKQNSKISADHHPSVTATTVERLQEVSSDFVQVKILQPVNSSSDKKRRSRGNSQPRQSQQPRQQRQQKRKSKELQQQEEKQQQIELLQHQQTHEQQQQPHEQLQKEKQQPKRRRKPPSKKKLQQQAKEEEEAQQQKLLAQQIQEDLQQVQSRQQAPQGQLQSQIQTTLYQNQLQHQYEQPQPLHHPLSQRLLPPIQQSQSQHLRLLQQAQYFQPLMQAFRQQQVQHLQQKQLPKQQLQHRQPPQTEDISTTSSDLATLLQSTLHDPRPVGPSKDTQINNGSSGLVGRSQSPLTAQAISTSHFPAEPQTSSARQRESRALSARPRKRTTENTANSQLTLAVGNNHPPVSIANTLHPTEQSDIPQAAVVPKHSPVEPGPRGKVPRLARNTQSRDFHNNHTDSFQRFHGPMSFNATHMAQFQLQSRIAGAPNMPNIPKSFPSSICQDNLKNCQHSVSLPPVRKATSDLVPRPVRPIVPGAMNPTKLPLSVSALQMLGANEQPKAIHFRQQLPCLNLEDKNLQMHLRAVHMARQQKDKKAAPLSPKCPKYPSWVKVPTEPSSSGRPESQTAESRTRDESGKQSWLQYSTQPLGQIDHYPGTPLNGGRSILDDDGQQQGEMSPRNSAVLQASHSMSSLASEVPTSPLCHQEQTRSNVPQIDDRDIPNEPLDLSKYSRSGTPATYSSQDRSQHCQTTLNNSESHEFQSPVHQPQQSVRQLSVSAADTRGPQPPTTISSDTPHSSLPPSAHIHSELLDCRPRSPRSLPSQSPSQPMTLPCPVSSCASPLRSQPQAHVADMANALQSPILKSKHQNEEPTLATNAIRSEPEVTNAAVVITTSSIPSFPRTETSIIQSVLLNSNDLPGRDVLSGSDYNQAQPAHSHLASPRQEQNKISQVRAVTTLGQNHKEEIINNKEVSENTQSRSCPPTPIIERSTSSDPEKIVPRLTVSPALTQPPRSAISQTNSSLTSIISVTIPSSPVTQTTPQSSPPLRTNSTYSEKSIAFQESTATDQIAKRKVVGLPVKDFFTNTVKKNTYSSLLMAKIATQKRRTEDNNLTSDEILGFVGPHATWNDASSTFEINNLLQRNSVIDLTDGDDECDVVSVSSRDSHGEEGEEQLGSAEGGNKVDDQNPPPNLYSDVSDPSDPPNLKSLNERQCDFMNIETHVDGLRQDLDYGAFDNASVSTVSADTTEILSAIVEDFNDPAHGQEQSREYQSYQFRSEFSPVADPQVSYNQRAEKVLTVSSSAAQDCDSAHGQDETVHSQQNVAVVTQAAISPALYATEQLRMVHTGKQMMAEKVKNVVAQRTSAHTQESDFSSTVSQSNGGVGGELHSVHDALQNPRMQATAVVQNTEQPAEEHENSTQRAAAALLELSSNPLYSNFEVCPETSDSYQEKVYQVHPILDEAEQTGHDGSSHQGSAHSNTTSKPTTKTGRRVGRPLKDKFDENAKTTEIPIAPAPVSMPTYCGSTILASSSLGLQNGQNLPIVLDPCQPPGQPYMMFFPIQRLPFLPGAIPPGGHPDFATINNPKILSSFRGVPQNPPGILQPKISKLMNFRPQNLRKGDQACIARPIASQEQAQIPICGSDNRAKTQILPVVDLCAGAIAHSNHTARLQEESMSKTSSSTSVVGGPQVSDSQANDYENPTLRPSPNPPVLSVCSSDTLHSNHNRDNASHNKDLVHIRSQSKDVTYCVPSTVFRAPNTFAVSSPPFTHAVDYPITTDTGAGASPHRVHDTYFTALNSVRNVPESGVLGSQAQPENDTESSSRKRKANPHDVGSDGKRQQLSKLIVNGDAEQERQISAASRIKERTISNQSEYYTTSEKTHNRMTHAKADKQAGNKFRNIVNGRSSSCSDINSEVLHEMMLEAQSTNVVARTNTENGLVVLSLQTESGEQEGNGMDQLCETSDEQNNYCAASPPRETIDLNNATARWQSEYPVISEQEKEEKVTSMLALMMQNRNRAEMSPMKN